MMKKILALFLALLLLPVAALAEAMSCEVMITAEEAKLTELLTASGAYNEEGAAILAGLLKDINLKVITQENGGSVELALAGRTLLDAVLQIDEMNVMLASTLMEGYAITLPVEVVALLDEALTPVVRSADWLSLLEDAVAAAAAQAEGIEVTSSRGSFSGHAYTSGVYCNTYTFDDAQIAAILDAFVTDDLRGHIQSVAAMLGLDAASLLTQFDAKNAQVAEENSYRYILRVVYDARMEPIGASLVALQGDTQLCTVSIGTTASDVQIVIGIGMDDENFWHSHAITIANETDADGTERLTFSGKLQEFTAPKEDDYAYALAASGTDQLRAAWSLEIAAKGDEVTWRMNHQERRGTSSTIDIVNWNGSWVSGQQFQSALTFTQSGEQYLVVTLNCQPCDPVSTDFSALTQCDLLVNDDLLSQIVNAASGALALRLLLAAPDLFMMLLQ